MMGTQDTNGHTRFCDSFGIDVARQKSSASYITMERTQLNVLVLHQYDTHWGIAANWLFKRLDRQKESATLRAT